MNCNEVRDELDAYVLGALDDDEARAVATHLASCAECRRMQREAEQAALLLPLALESASPLVPPADLKARLVETVRSSAPSPSPALQGTADNPAQPKGRFARRLPLPNGRRSRSWSVSTYHVGWRWAAAAAALVIVIASVAWSVRLSSALDSERATRERVEAFYSNQQELVLEVVDSAKTTRRILRPTDDGSRAYGKLFVRSDLPDVVVMAARLPAPPEGQAYHLWLISAGQIIDAGAFPIDDQGFGLLTLKAERAGPTYDAVELRLQPVGAASPSGTVVLRWDAASTDG